MKIDELIPKNLMRLKSVLIGSQIWSHENITLPVDGCVCYDDNPDNCLVFGPLYTYSQALVLVQKFPGWRLPSKEDVDTLISFLGGMSKAGKEIKVGGSSNFNALLAGYRATNGKYCRKGEQTGFWTSTPDGDDKAWKFYVTAEDESIKFHPVSRNYGDSIRLIKEVDRKL